MSPDPFWISVEVAAAFKDYTGFMKIAEGAFAEVFSATNRNNLEKIAIKRLKQEFNNDPEKKQMFENDRRFLQKLKHRSIPSFVDSYYSDKESMFLMEHIDGISLNELLERIQASQTFVPPEVVFEIMHEICKTLEYLHQYTDPSGNISPIIHCDIKPKNIMLNSIGKILLIDFNVAMHVQSERKNVAGTYRYMPPEMFTGLAVSPQNDLFALMMTFYEMMMLSPLISQQSISAIFGFLVSQKHLEKIRKLSLAKPIEQLLLKGLAFKPENRFATARQLDDALSSCAAALGYSLQNSRLPDFASTWCVSN